MDHGAESSGADESSRRPPPLPGGKSVPPTLPPAKEEEVPPAGPPPLPDEGRPQVSPPPLEPVARGASAGAKEVVVEEEVSPQGAAADGGEPVVEQATGKAEEPSSATPPEVRFALERCRPLNDPVGHWARILPWVILLQIPIAAAGAAMGIMEGWGKTFSGWPLGFVLLVSLITAVVLIVPGYLMVRPMVVHAKKRKVLYLRAFSHDRGVSGDRALRKSLRAAMPGSLALAGIRPPDKRAGSWFRFLGDGLVALRYLGSNQFELEAADRNWLARLLASMGEAGALVIDLRETTPFVHDEMGLVSAMQAGARRTILIGDESKEAREWKEEFDAIASSLGCEPVEATVLRIPEEEELAGEAFRRELAGVFGQIPDEPMAVTPAALHFAQGRVPDEAWDTAWRETPLARLVLIFLPLQVLGFLLPIKLVMPIIKLLGLIFYPFYFLSLGRLVANAIRQKRLGIRPRPGLVALGLSPLPLVLLMVVTVVVPAIAAKALERARATSVTLQVRQLEQAMMAYEMEYGEPLLMPSPFDSSAPMGDNFIRILAADPRERSANPKGVRFIDPGIFRRGDHGGIGFVDDFGRPIRILLPSPDREPATMRLGDTDYRLSPGLPGGAVSPGPDGELGTRDDIVSPGLK